MKIVGNNSVRTVAFRPLKQKIAVTITNTIDSCLIAAIIRNLSLF